MAQFPRNEAFKSNTAAGFEFGGSARLTGTGATGNDAVGTGYLRLTNASTFQAGYAIDTVGFPSSEGFTISFDFFSYGGDGADGFSVFLVDDDQPGGFRIGATGGALGYAQRNITPVAPGVSRGYLGIGIDEFGNYANDLEGRSGGYPSGIGPGKLVPNAISLRGAGDGSASTDYAYLTGTGPDALGFDLDVPTARAQAGSPDYRRAFIDVVASGAAPNRKYKITVRIQHGTQVRTAVENFFVNIPPERLRLGFASSTGGSTNIHEIRNLNIVQVPYANNDLATTDYNSEPILIKVLDNDEAPGSSIDPSSVDLDPSTSGIQSEIVVPGKGSFSVNSEGVVSFTPSGSFAGIVEVPYTIKSILGDEYTSSPANIRVNVRGADVATTIDGPMAIKPNTWVTYSMATTNEGTLPALAVVPKLQLPMALPASSLMTMSGGDYDPATGMVTFTSIPVLNNGTDAVTNSVTFMVPSSAPATITSVAASNSTVPDPTPDNNTAQLAASVGAPLPVQLMSFKARADQSDALLNWATASETNNARFEVERSADGTHFDRIGQLPGKGTTSQNSSYAYRDHRAGYLGAKAMYYRLRQVDTDGGSQYSKVETVQFSSAKTAISIYPNPAPGTATLDLTDLAPGEYNIQVLDITGRVVFEQMLQGSQQNPLDVQRLVPGSYIVRVRGGATNLALPLVRR
ncbi:T9SS type A sorting domain-containing protein [Hymenobacter cavernae]|uniref:T9SS C-terminal target domain-containing protein n=1 Tax=Hymenobacter cavernae TaxID=2044852 RepID=A0ABQ1TZI3_9BACT|nr:T9SS type A sorting domain-containing protein [Hymenobacter cavernae]GGF04951.1 hypothetical protein GCM10011383_15110 [Hymenobacter cavernae]